MMFDLLSNVEKAYAMIVQGWEDDSKEMMGVHVSVQQ